MSSPVSPDDVENWFSEVIDGYRRLIDEDAQSTKVAQDGGFVVHNPYQEFGKAQSQWFEDTFRLNTATTPRGGKALKEDAKRVLWAVRNRVAFADNKQAGLDQLETAFEAFRPKLGPFVAKFGRRAASVPRSQKTAYATYRNKRGLSAKSFKRYVDAMDRILANLRGWRSDVVGDDLVVVFAGPSDFRGTATGVYRSGEDALYVRATPAVLKRGEGYGSAEYILVHELGHRYERKRKTDDFDRGPWRTTRYSRKDGEAFAELFALGHFGIDAERGRSFADVVQRFEHHMAREQLRRYLREQAPDMSAAEIDAFLRRPDVEARLRRADNPRAIPVDENQVYALATAMYDSVLEDVRDLEPDQELGAQVFARRLSGRIYVGSYRDNDVTGLPIVHPVFRDWQRVQKSGAVAGGYIEVAKAWLQDDQQIPGRMRGRAIVVDLNLAVTPRQWERSKHALVRRIGDVLRHEIVHARDVMFTGGTGELAARSDKTAYYNDPTEVRAYGAMVAEEVARAWRSRFASRRAEIVDKSDPGWGTAVAAELRSQRTVQKLLEQSPVWERLRRRLTAKNQRYVRQLAARRVDELWDALVAPRLPSRDDALRADNPPSTLTASRKRVPPGTAMKQHDLFTRTPNNGWNADFDDTERIERYKLDVIGDQYRRAADIARQIETGIEAAADVCQMNPPVCEANLDIPRSEMPQLLEETIGELAESENPKSREFAEASIAVGGDPSQPRGTYHLFLDDLKNQGVTIDDGATPVGLLKATQREIKAGKVYGMADSYLSGTFPKIATSPIIISSDNHILDGHHRWAAMLTVDPSRKIRTIRVGIPMRELLQRAMEYPGVFRADMQGEVVPFDAPVSWAPGGFTKTKRTANASAGEVARADNPADQRAGHCAFCGNIASPYKHAWQCPHCAVTYPPVVGEGEAWVSTPEGLRWQGQAGAATQEENPNFALMEAIEDYMNYYPDLFVDDVGSMGGRWYVDVQDRDPQAVAREGAREMLEEAAEVSKSLPGVLPAQAHVGQVDGDWYVDFGIGGPYRNVAGWERIKRRATNPTSALTDEVARELIKARFPEAERSTGNDWSVEAWELPDDHYAITDEKGGWQLVRRPWMSDADEIVEISDVTYDPARWSAGLRNLQGFIDAQRLGALSADLDRVGGGEFVAAGEILDRTENAPSLWADEALDYLGTQGWTRRKRPKDLADDALLRGGGPDGETRYVMRHRTKDNALLVKDMPVGGNRATRDFTILLPIQPYDLLQAVTPEGRRGNPQGVNAPALPSKGAVNRTSVLDLPVVRTDNPIDYTRPWDGRAAKKRLRAHYGLTKLLSQSQIEALTPAERKAYFAKLADYRGNFLYYDRNAPLDVSKYKLPVADVIDGKPRLVPHAVYAAAVVMEGGRSGINLYAPGDEERIEKVLQALYKKIGKKPPPFDKPADRSARKRKQKAATQKRARRTTRLSKVDKEVFDAVIVASKRARGNAPKSARYLVVAGKQQVPVRTRRQVVDTAVQIWMDKGKGVDVRAFPLK